MRPLRPILVATGAAALVTLLGSAVPAIPLAYRDASLHVGIETAAALIAALGAFLVFGRYRERPGLRDLAITEALALFAVANAASGIRSAVAGARVDAFTTWSSLALALVSGLVFALAAFLPDTRFRTPGRPALAATAAGTVVVAAACLPLALLSDRLPAGISRLESPPVSFPPSLVGHPLLLAGQMLAGLLLSVAAIGFYRLGVARGDEFMHWLAAAAAVSAFARLNYLFFPSLYSPWIFTGDLLRLASYGLLLFGAAREIRSYWQRLAEAAVLEERRRLARDLHDGLAQELAFIANATEGAPAAAATRALDEARRAISALSRRHDEPLETSLVEAAQRVASRVGVRLELRVDTGIEVPAETREALVRIVREAVANAGRHGRAESVLLELHNGSHVRLCVVDDGSGFDPEAPPLDGHFGLTSMRERAEALGAEFQLTSRPGHGTRLEVVLP